MTPPGTARAEDPLNGACRSWHHLVSWSRARGKHRSRNGNQRFSLVKFILIKKTVDNPKFLRVCLQSATTTSFKSSGCLLISLFVERGTVLLLPDTYSKCHQMLLFLQAAFPSLAYEHLMYQSLILSSHI